MAGQYQNVTPGFIAGQQAQSLGEAAKNAREAIAFGQMQDLNHIMSKNTNPDGSLNHTGFINEAAKSGYGPSALKAWYDNQGQVLDTASKQTMTNSYLKMMGLDPNALRDQRKIGELDKQNPNAYGKAKNGSSVESLFTKPTTGSVGSLHAAPAPSQESESFLGSLGDKISSGFNSLFGDKPATKESYSYLNGNEKYESDKPLVMGASGIVGNVSNDRPIIELDEQFKPIYADQNSGYNTDNQGMLTQNTSGGLGSIVGLDQDAGALAGGSQFTPVAKSADSGYEQPAQPMPPQAPIQAPVQVQTPNAPVDTRSIFERLADSGTGTPNVSTAKAMSDSDLVNIFDYNKVKDVGDVRIKNGIDSALAKLGQTPDQNGVNNLLRMAAETVAPPVLVSNKPEDMQKFLQESAALPAKRMEAMQKVAKDLASGNSTAIGEQLGREQYGLSERQNNRAEQQVSHPAIKGYLPTPDEKVKLTNSSAAIRGMQDLIKNPPSPNTAEWKPFQMMLGKELIMAMGLPVAEGMIDEVSAKVANGYDIEKVLAGSNLPDFVLGGVKEALRSAMGINDIKGAQLLVSKASTYARDKWGVYGAGTEFDKWFPAYGYTPSKEDKVGKTEPKAKNGKGASDLVGKGEAGSRSNPITYTKGMKTEPGKWYNVGGVLSQAKGGK